MAHKIAISITVLAFFYGIVVDCQHPKLLSKLNQCGNWNVLADIDCTASPRVNVQYTREMHSLQMRMIKHGISPEKHYHLVATNVSYATASNLSHITSYTMLDTLDDEEQKQQQQQQQQLVIINPRKLRGAADATLVLPFWTNIPSGQSPSSKGGTTYDAELKTADFIITSASGGTVLSFSTCGVGSSSGDTYLRLVDTASGKQLAFDDDSCGAVGGSSLLSYTVPGPATSFPTMTFKLGCFSTSTCSATVTVTGISSLGIPTMVPSTAPTRTATPTVKASTISQFPISVTGWYQYTASIGMKSATFLPLGLNTPIDYGLSISYWINCRCARYSWGNNAHTLVNDIFGYPLVYLVANVSPPSASPSTAPPSKATTAAPSKRAPSAVPTSAVTSPSPSKSAAPTSAAPSSLASPISQYPVTATGWYEFTASIGMSSAKFLPLGLDTPIDYGLTILQWITCGCARYSWGNSAHTLVNDVFNYPLVYLLATVPTSLPTLRPSNPSRTPTRNPTFNPATSLAPTTSIVLSYNLKYRGGKINPKAVVQLILWGPSWVSKPGDKISGLELFYQGWSGSGYANTVVEYTGSNGQVTNAITYGGYVIDSRTPPSAIDTGTILNEVCAMIPNPDPSGNGYYVVYTELPRGAAGYCGWHSIGSCKGIRVQFGFIFNLDNDNGCSSGTPPSNPGWTMSQGMHGLASVTAHELAEMITDPGAGDGWLDSNGMENGDKCAWTFPTANPVFSNGITWKIQGEWSNAAAIDKRGYPTTSGGSTVYGCIGSA